ncbi:unnamed protein product, partial [Ectocarpus fasciculatus]
GLLLAQHPDRHLSVGEANWTRGLGTWTPKTDGKLSRVRTTFTTISIPRSTRCSGPSLPARSFVMSAIFSSARVGATETQSRSAIPATTRGTSRKNTRRQG